MCKIKQFHKPYLSKMSNMSFDMSLYKVSKDRKLQETLMLLDTYERGMMKWSELKHKNPLEARNVNQ